MKKILDSLLSNLTRKRQRGLRLKQMWRPSGETATTTYWDGEVSGEGVGDGEDVADDGEVAAADGSDGEADVTARAEP